MSSTLLNPPTNPDHFKLGALSFSERVIYWTIVLMPLCWLSGVQVLLYSGIALFLLIKTFSFHSLMQRSLPACVWAWLAMSMAMLWTAALGLCDVGFGFREVAAAAITFIKSYFLIFICLALPFWDQIRVQVVTRAVAWLSAGYLVTIAVELVMIFAKIGRSGFIPPLAKLIPGDKLSLQVGFGEMQAFFGIPLPRTSLYTPDPPILGVCAVLCFFICLGESDRRLRRVALIGCLVSLLISFSRLAWVCFPLALLIMFCFRNKTARQASLWGASATSLTCALLGLTLTQLIQKPLAVFTKARASSSEDRDLVVRKTIEAWQQSPWVGWGVMRGSVRWYVYDITLGSFSTYASVLYLHGIFGFVVFLLALLLTLVSFWGEAVRGNPLHKRAFAALVALYILCNATPLSWMTVYFWFFFVWLGAILADTYQQRSPVSRWEQLAEQTW